VLLADPASAPWLVRGALAAGDRALAARIVSAINDTARDNPTLAVIRASAKHAEGLLAGDVSRLQHAADQLFISTHTVAFHLRQMFRKLDISSRVDLARIALAHARPGDGETP
jgi:DNA-binding NarL/FixJ family response regulator